MKTKVFFASFLCLYASVMFAANKTQAAEWGYKGNVGPSRWAELKPEYTLCADGKMQSPINIPKGTTTGNTILKIGYTPALLNIVNNGLTELTIGSKTITFNDGHSVQLNFDFDTNEGIILDEIGYHLVNIHFHAPSETTILGLAFPLEMHFVHQGDHGEVAVIAVLVKGGAEHSELQTIVDNIPADKGVAHSLTGKTVNPANLLPSKKSFYTYAGSLTVPPCYEGIRWLVMSEPITASSAQIARIKHAVGGNNARPIQPLNKRPVSFVSSEVKSVSRSGS